MNTPINFNIDVVLNDLSRQTVKLVGTRDEDGNRFEDFVAKGSDRTEVDRPPRTESEPRNDAPRDDDSYEREPLSSQDRTSTEPAHDRPVADNQRAADEATDPALSEEVVKSTDNENTPRTEASDAGRQSNDPQESATTTKADAVTPAQTTTVQLASAETQLEKLLQQGQAPQQSKLEAQIIATDRPDASQAAPILQKTSAVDLAAATPRTAQQSSNPIVAQVLPNEIAAAGTRDVSTAPLKSSTSNVIAQVAAAPQPGQQTELSGPTTLRPQNIESPIPASNIQTKAPVATTGHQAEATIAPSHAAPKESMPAPHQTRPDLAAELAKGQQPVEEANLKSDMNLQALLAGRSGQASATSTNGRTTNSIKTPAQTIAEPATQAMAPAQAEQSPATVKFAPLPPAVAVAADLSSADGIVSRDMGQSSTSGIPEIAGRSTPLNQPITAAARSALPVSNSAAVLNQIALQISKNVSDGVAKFEIMMDPPELGRIEVRMELNNEGRLQAHLSADKQETLDLMQRDARQLEKALSALGVDADSDSLEFSLREDDQSLDFSQRGDNEPAHSIADQDQDLEVLNLLSDVDLGTTMETYGFKVREPLGVSLSV